jgi:hypothetical protein
MRSGEWPTVGCVLDTYKKTFMTPLFYRAAISRHFFYIVSQNCYFSRRDERTTRFPWFFLQRKLSVYRGEKIV